tara:strand:+ start:20526 stop:20903 length:378 start_codon:yes stop_codon:yes gene_type:complete
MIVVILDGNCKLCRRCGAIIERIDWLDKIQIIYSTEDRGSSYLKQHSLDTDIDNIVAIYGNDEFSEGVYAWRSILSRLPLGWFIVWLMYIPFTMSIWGLLYDMVRRNRYWFNGCDESGSCKIKLK